MKILIWELGIRKVAASLAGLLFVVCALSLAAAEIPGEATTFDSLTVRGTIYTRVVVVDVSKRHVSFRSAQGFSTVLLGDLDPEAQSRLRLGGPVPSNTAGTTNLHAAANNPSAMPVKARETPAAAASGDVNEKDSEDTDMASKPFQLTVASISGISLFGLGCLALMAGQIWMIVAGFRVSPGWGIALIVGTFVAGIITSMFCRAHWDVAKHPLCVKAGGVLLVAAGWLLWGH